MEKLISVIMPAFNSEPYINESIKSILDQNYKNIELIIVDDGSKDNTGNIIKKWSLIDKRIKYFYQKNKGIISSLNKGIKIAKGDYIARMDSDDKSYPNRFTEQINYMEKYRLDVCGSWMEESDFTKILKKRVFPVDHDEILTNLLLFGRTLPHPTVIFRKKVFSIFNYSEEYGKYAQDYLLWCCIGFQSKFRLGNCPKFLFKYRIHQNQIAFKKSEMSSMTVEKINNAFLRKLNRYITREEIDLNHKIKNSDFSIGINDLKDYWNFLKKVKVILLNYDVKVSYLDERWFDVCLKYSHIGYKVFFLFKKTIEKKTMKNSITLLFYCIKNYLINFLIIKFK